MNILNSRLRALADRLLDADQWEKEDVEREIDNAEGMLSMVEPITEVRSAGLEFASETFFCRHLMTQGRIALLRARLVYDKEGDNVLRERDEHLGRACRLYKAASTTIEKAESLLPMRSATLEGEKFWDRFIRIAGERENDAERALIDSRREHRVRRWQGNQQ